jgi:hypothetical protein
VYQTKSRKPSRRKLATIWRVFLRNVPVDRMRRMPLSSSVVSSLLGSQVLPWTGRTSTANRSWSAGVVPLTVRQLVRDPFMLTPCVEGVQVLQKFVDCSSWWVYHWMPASAAS